MYKERYRLSIDSEPDEGMSVELMLLWNLEKGEGYEKNIKSRKKTGMLEPCDRNDLRQGTCLVWRFSEKPQDERTDAKASE